MSVRSQSVGRLLGAVLLLALVTSLLMRSAFTSSITVVPGNVVYSKTHTIVMTDLVPNSCPTTGTNAINSILGWVPTNGSGGASSGSWVTYFGGGGNSVWLWNEKNTTTGSGGNDLNGGNGADCMVPGAVRNVAGTSLRIGGGKGTDICYAASSGTYTFNSCNATPGTPYTTHAVANPSFA